MNKITRDAPGPTRDEAKEALALLRDWAARAAPEDLVQVDPALAGLVEGARASDYPTLARAYPEDFRIDAAYRAGLPDLQNGPSSLIRGARTAIQHVGISNFRLPIRYRTRAGGEMTLETSVTGTVSLEAEKKGINMSRIMRSFYGYAEETFSFDVMARALDSYLGDLGSVDARLQMRLSYPMKVQSLRSNLAGYQYYDMALEIVDRGGERLRILHLDYVYSSTCPDRKSVV